MNPSAWLSSEALALAAPWCAGLVMMVFGAFLLLVRGRVPADRAPRPLRLALEERLQALGFRRNGGRWDGYAWGRPLRVTMIDDAREPVLELATPVPTNTLLVRIGESESSEREAMQNRLGDPPFDRWFEVAGVGDDLSMLDASVRRAMCNAALRARPHLERGLLVLHGAGVGDLDETLAPMMGIATALDAAAKVPPRQRMAALLAKDPAPLVRLRFLEFLASQVGGPDLVSLARGALTDPDPSVRTHAAILLSDTPRVLEVAKLESAPYRARRRAGKYLLERGSDGERLEAAMALAHGPPKVHPVAFELAVSIAGGGRAVEGVLQVLAASSVQEVAREAMARLPRTFSDRPRESRPRSAPPRPPEQDVDPTMMRPPIGERTPRPRGR